MLTKERLRQILDYDPATGVFRWKRGNARNVKAGDVAGSDMSGYRAIRLDGGRYKAHRLAWLYVHGDWPVERIDHINCDRGDNRIANLRLATNSQNKANMPKRRDNTSGFKGVSFYRQTNRWRAGIGHNGKQMTIGYFSTPEEAHQAYEKKAVELFGQFARA